MNKIQRFLLPILLILCLSPVITAQNPTEYDPGNPPEPENLFSLTLQMNHSSAGYFSGNGNYPAGKSVRVIAYAYSGYQFTAWKEGDSVISSARDFYYSMPSRKVTLTAHYVYSPTNPGEPEYKYTLKLYTDPEGSGYFSNDNVYQLPGTSYNVFAYPYSGYSFKGWYRNDTLVSISSPYRHTTQQWNDTLYARFEYQPGNPGEPLTGTSALYNLSLLTPASEKGRTVAFPVHLFNRNTTVYNATFDIKFPQGAIVDLAAATLSGRKNGHILTTEQTDDSTYRFSVNGADTLAFSESSGILMTVPVTIPQEWDVNRTYPVVIRNATLRTTAGTVVCPVKAGGIRVLSEEGGLFASFYPDIYLNRAHFVNLSSATADNFLWDFGDGSVSTEKSPLHSYSAGGPYTVKLRVSKGSQQDSAQFNIVITEKKHWRISGNFSLNSQLTDVRNFTSASELFTLFAESGIAGASVIQVANAQNFEVVMDSTIKIMLTNLSQKLKVSGYLMTFTAIDTLNKPLIDFTDNINQEALDLLIELWNYLPVNRVQFAVQHVVLNSNAIRSFKSQQLCSGNSSIGLDFSVINPELVYTWNRVPTQVATTGYLAGGNQLLPSMALFNGTEKADTLIYAISTSISNTSFEKLLTIKIIVLPLLSGPPVLSGPAEGSEQASVSLSYSWSKINNAVYDLYIWEEGGNEPAVPTFGGITTTTFNNATFCKYGKRYNWKVMARGGCNSVSSTTGTFSIRTLPDLIVTGIQHPQELYPGDQVTVVITIKNQGGKTPASSYWRDEIALSRNENLEGILSLTSLATYRTVLSDSSYTVSMKFALPLDTVPYSRFVVRSDIYNNLLESDETNNVFVSQPITIIQPRIYADDYNRLRTLYQLTAGTNWKRRWNINSDVIVASHWPGVSFNRGKVSAINLNSNNLKGNLLAIVFQFSALKRLELYDNQLKADLSLLADTLQDMTEKADSINYLNIGKNELTGEISAFAGKFPQLTYLNLSENSLGHLQEPLSATINQLNLQYQKVQIDSMNMTANPVFDTLPSVCRYNHSNRQFTSWPGFSILHQNATVGYISYYSNKYHLSWNNSTGWRIPSGAPLELMQHNGTGYGARSPFKLFFVRGDANIDSNIDILDVQHSLNYVLKNNPALFNFDAANTFGDDQITVQDLVTTVEMILENDSTPDPEGISPQRIALKPSPNQVYIDHNRLMLSTTTSVAALDIRISKTNRDSYRNLISNEQFQYSAIDTHDGGMRFILFSPNGQEFETGTTQLGYFEGSQPTVNTIMLSDRYARVVPSSIGSAITANSELSNEHISLEQQSGKLIIRTTETLENLEITLFNIQGLAILRHLAEAMAPGEVIMNLNNHLPAGIYLLQLQSSSNNTTNVRHFKMFISN